MHTLVETLFIEYICRNVYPHIYDHDVKEDPSGDYVISDGEYRRIERGHQPPYNVKRYSLVTCKPLRIARKAINDAKRFEEAIEEERKTVEDRLSDIKETNETGIKAQNPAPILNGPNSESHSD